MSENGLNMRPLIPIFGLILPDCRGVWGLTRNDLRLFVWTGLVYTFILISVNVVQSQGSGSLCIPIHNWYLIKRFWQVISLKNPYLLRPFVLLLCTQGCVAHTPTNTHVHTHRDARISWARSIFFFSKQSARSHAHTLIQLHILKWNYEIYMLQQLRE